MIKRILKKFLIKNETFINNNYYQNIETQYFEQLLVLQSKSLTTNKKLEFSNEMKNNRLFDFEFKVFSQFGDDGIINWLVNYLDIEVEKFVEFGVTDYVESNTRFLLINNNWDGLVMDGSVNEVNKIINSSYYWKHNLQAKQLWVTKENIYSFIKEHGFDGEIGLLHIDLDGNDFWIFNELEQVKPVIFIAEYNSVFGLEPWTIPYDPSFYRTAAHFSNLYWGSGLKPIHDLALERGYSFIGCNSAGNNAYFVRSDKMKDLKSISLELGFVESKYRESRNEKGNLSYISGIERINVIKGLPVFNTITKKLDFI
jgi:hypothetical protein